jgi:hypothetical protein
VKGRLYYVAPCDEEKDGHIVRTWDIMRREPDGSAICICSGSETREDARRERDRFLRAVPSREQEAA